MAEHESAAPETAASPQVLADDTRQQLLSRPELILGDRDLMRALIGAREAEIGENVIDIRGRAMEALEERLSRLEVTHESVISNAYENQSGMNIIHRAVLALLEPSDFAAFLAALETTVAPILRLESLRLIFETGGPAQLPQGIASAVQVVPAGALAQLIAAGPPNKRGDAIILRSATALTQPLHPAGVAIRSEALLPIDLGPGRWPALLLMGSSDGDRFSPSHGTDLLRFFTQTFRLALLGWLRE